MVLVTLLPSAMIVPAVGVLCTAVTVIRVERTMVAVAVPVTDSVCADAAEAGFAMDVFGKSAAAVGVAEIQTVAISVPPPVALRFPIWQVTPAFPVAQFTGTGGG